MLLAQSFTRALAKLLGPDLKAVFVTGSVAANMATPKSDINVVIVLEQSEANRKTRLEVFSSLEIQRWQYKIQPRFTATIL